MAKENNIEYTKVNEVLLADIRQRQAKLRRELAELDTAERAIQATSATSPIPMRKT